MVKVIKYPNPDLKDLEQTKLTANISASATSLSVLNTAGFSANDFIVIEEVGNERAELVQIASIVDETTINLTSGVKFSHYADVIVRKTLYNQARLYRSSDNVTYNLLQTQDIQWQDKYNQIVFVDNTGDDSYYYKVAYFNSFNNLEQESSVIKTVTPTGYVTVEEFKTLTSIKGDDSLIAYHLKLAAEKVRRRLYAIKRSRFGNSDTEFYLIQEMNLEIADGNLDGKIDKEDFVAWEEDKDGIRTYVSSDIVSVDVDAKKVVFGSSHPASDKQLVIEYYMTYRKLDEMPEVLKRLQTLYAVISLFRNIPIKRLQRGISSWSINNVSISFDGSAIRDTIESAEQEIKELIRDFQRLYIRKTRARELEPRDISYIKSTLRFR